MQLSFIFLVSALSMGLAAPVTPSLSTGSSLHTRETPVNAFLSLLLEYLPTLDASLESLVSTLTTFEAFLALVSQEQTVYNDLSSGSCKPYTILFARGTSEPGNVGILVGPPFFDAVRSKVGSANVAVQGVNNYAASVAGYLAGGDPNGSAQMATQIKQAKAKCPNTKLIASGYSQGGQIVHNAIGKLDAATASWISKVVIFGDPDDGQAIANVLPRNIDVYCNPDDNICVNGDLILPAHLIYAENAVAAAAFVAS